MTVGEAGGWCWCWKRFIWCNPWCGSADCPGRAGWRYTWDRRAQECSLAAASLCHRHLQGGRTHTYQDRQRHTITDEHKDRNYCCNMFLILKLITLFIHTNKVIYSKKDTTSRMNHEKKKHKNQNHTAYHITTPQSDWEVGFKTKKAYTLLE